jgi:GDP-L-fucose synthase
MIDKAQRIFVAGHNGLVGSSLARLLGKDRSNHVVVASRTELDLLNQAAVQAYFAKHQFDQVYLAAAKVGGIHANNTYPADFIYENLVIQSNVIHAVHTAGVQKLLFLGSSCIYPKHADQPMVESALLTGVLEPTNEPYAIAKIAGIKLCESYNRQHGRDYRSVMPTNLYGPGDNFHPDNSHVIPALIRRFHEAQKDKASVVRAWGSGSPKRDFLYVDDMARASIHVMNLSQSSYAQVTQSMLSHVNIGSGTDCTIKELAQTIAKVVGYTGVIEWDLSKPDGTPRKLLDVQRATALGWQAQVTLEAGLRATYQWFLSHASDLRS